MPGNDRGRPAGVYAADGWKPPLEKARCSELRAYLLRLVVLPEVPACFCMTVRNEGYARGVDKTCILPGCLTVVSRTQRDGRSFCSRLRVWRLPPAPLGLVLVVQFFIVRAFLQVGGQ